MTDRANAVSQHFQLSLEFEVLCFRDFFLAQDVLNRFVSAFKLAEEVLQLGNGFGVSRRFVFKVVVIVCAAHDRLAVAMPLAAAVLD